MASKTNVWAEVQELLSNHKAKPALVEALEAILAPQKSGGTSTNPPKVVDGVTYHYCRFHREYEAEDKMVLSNGKSKGYCRAAISAWNKRNTAVKKLEAEISELIMAGDFEQAKECSEELRAAKTDLSNYETYDITADWAAFNK